MDLKINQLEIKSQVVGKLIDSVDNLDAYLKNLDGIVEYLETVTEGEVFSAFKTKYYEVVQAIYSKINGDMCSYAEELDEICAAFEQADIDMSTDL